MTSDSSGLIETIRNTISIHSIKKEAYTRGWNTKGTVYTLGEYYERVRSGGDMGDLLNADIVWIHT